MTNTNYADLCERLRKHDELAWDDAQETIFAGADAIEALTAKCALLAASLAQEEKRSADLEKDAARYRWLRLDRTEDQTRFVLDMIIDNCEKYLDEAIDSAVAAQKEASNG